jgi:seryl-tRNA synthetase
VKDIIKTAIKKTTLELVYQVVDERTEEILSEIKEIKKRQEDDFRYLIQKMDSDIGQLRSEVRNELSQLNQRIDTIIQMLMNIKQDQK